MPLDLSILYRGTLSSCNYDCSYCPFAKHWESPEELQADRQGLESFCRWVTSRKDDRLAVFFTPWGEALVRSWYRDAIVKLGSLPHVSKIAVQTNLSCNLDWLYGADAEKIGLWCTYHPGQTARATFLRQCQQLRQLGIRHSVGCVGLREHVSEISALREELPDDTYLWINAYKSEPAYYDQQLLDAFAGIDPLFPINNIRHESRGRACRTGHRVVTIDSRGDVRRCHFVQDVIGNVYESNVASFLMPRACPNETCGCHIGYVHLEYLQLDRVYGDGILERIPSGAPVY
jgi:MoaA/NifB/PqqE/SkfB family radical SAM enzyme